ncbi:MAG: hypothetical protein ISR72_11565 [Methylobacter sp.]|nr:hypothetical protein [Methylobacter sp.]
MKKLAPICAGLLILLSAPVFAETHAAEALEHASAAMIHGKAGHTPVMLEHAKAALEDALAASIEAKGVLKNSIEAGAEELQEAIDQGTLGHVGRATKHLEAAVTHLNAGNEK